jgi:hypothetical protein
MKNLMETNRTQYGMFHDAVCFFPLHDTCQMYTIWNEKYAVMEYRGVHIFQTLSLLVCILRYSLYPVKANMNLLLRS